MTKRIEIENRIIKVLETSLHIKLSLPHLNLIDNGMIDSLTLIELIVALEDEFDIEIPFDNLNLQEFENVEVITNKIEKLLQCKL